MTENPTEPYQWWNEFKNIRCNYRFVPLCKDVQPAPLSVDEISHVKPLPGGMSGEIKFTLRAKSPVYFGGEKESGTTNFTQEFMVYGKREIPKVQRKEFSVRVTNPLELENHYIITGRTLRGMLRSVYRIATFSALGPIENPESRGDLVTRRHRAYLNQKAQSRLGENMSSVVADGTERTQKLQEGFLSLLDEEWYFIPVESQNNANDAVDSLRDPQELKKHIPTSFIEGPKQSKPPYFSVIVQTNGESYLSYAPIKNEDINNASLRKLSFKNGKIKSYAECKIQRRDGIFRIIPVHPDAIDNFKRIHPNRDIKQANRAPEVLFAVIGKDKSDQEIAVAMGRSGLGNYSFKQAAEHSISDVAKRTQADALERVVPSQSSTDKEYYDWANSLFGFVDEAEMSESPHDPLKARVKIGFAFAEKKLGALWPANNCFLSIPASTANAGYAPFYLYPEDKEKPANYDSKNAKINGRKRYPLVNDVDNVKTILGKNYTIKPGETYDGLQGKAFSGVGNRSHLRLLEAKEDCNLDFDGRIRFHNLHPLELGALLWCLSLDDDKSFTNCGGMNFHSAGRMRPYWFGQLQPLNISLDRPSINPQAQDNPASHDENCAHGLVKRYKIAVGRWIRKTEGHTGSQGSVTDEVAIASFDEKMKPLLKMTNPIDIEEANNKGLFTPRAVDAKVPFHDFEDLYALTQDLPLLNQEGWRGQKERGDMINSRGQQPNDPSENNVRLKIQEHLKKFGSVLNR